MATLKGNEIALPPAETWSLLIDVAEWPKWMPRMKGAVESLAVRDLKEGSRIEIVWRWSPSMKPFLIIERVEPPHTLAYRAEIRPFYQLLLFLFVSSYRAVSTTWIIEPAGPNSEVTVTVAFDYSLLGLILGGWWMRIVLSKSISGSIQKAFIKYARSTVPAS